MRNRMADGPGRRAVLTGMAAAALTPAYAQVAGRRGMKLVAGGYRREGNPGLLPLSYDTASGRWTASPPVGAAQDASFGVYNPRFGLHYVVEESADGMIAALRPGADGGWTRVAYLSSRGADPCHLALDATGLFLAVANYSSGSIVLFRLDAKTGAPIGPGELRTHVGSGPNADRQKGPHAHWVGFTPDGRWLQAVDLGADAVFAYPFDPARGTLGEAVVAYRGVPGAGPRHLARHPNQPRAYLVNELDNSVTILRTAGGAKFERIATVSSLPQGFTGKSSAAEIALNRAGTRLYVSNRGHDSIAVFAVGADGGLRLLQHVPCGGRGPRHFLLVEPGDMLVANEQSGNVAGFRVDAEGRLAPHGPGMAVPGVTFVGPAD